MPERKFDAGSGYRYGFNGKENDKDISEGGQDYGMRIYDGRLGRFLSVDPLTRSYPYYSPYQFSGNGPIKFIDLDGGEPKEPDQVEYKGKVKALNTVFKLTGGDDKYEFGSADKELGKPTATVDKSKFFANDNGNNSVVNETSQFIVTNEGAIKSSKDLVNKLLGDFIWGAGPENIVFPENGKFSSELKSSIAVGETLVKWGENKYKDGIYRWDMSLRGEINVDMNSGSLSLEHFLGSVAVKISNLNQDQIKVEVFNVTSFSSSFVTKDLPIVKWFVSVPLSTKRPPGEMFPPTYSNTSQYFSFTMSTSEADKLIKQFNTGIIPPKK